MLAARPLRSALVAVAAAVALTGCGETQRIEPTSHATAREVASVPATVFPAPTKSVAPTATSGATGSPTASPTGGGGGSSVNATATNTFDPKTLTVKAGTEVTWTASGFHSVTSGTAKGGKAAGPMDSENGFATYSVKFDKKGTYSYFCVPHASLGMEGEIVVT